MALHGLFSLSPAILRRGGTLFWLSLSLGISPGAWAQHPPAAGIPPAAAAENASTSACGQEVQVPAELQDVRTTVSVYAVSQEKEQDLYHLRGNVVVTYRDGKLTADQATYDDSSGEVVATGHVTLTDPSAHIEAEEAHYNVLTGQGWFSNGAGYLRTKLHRRSRVLATENPLYVRASRVERLDSDTYWVRHARLTSCTSEGKGWSVGTRRARLELGDKLVAHWVDLRFLKVPIFYSPILIHSVAHHPRQTGFLLPHVGNSTQKGFIFGEGFFWAINPSADLLLGVEDYSQRGLGRGGRFRARPSSSSDIAVDYFGVSDRQTGQFGASGQTVRAVGHAGDLFNGFRGVLDVDYLSSLTFRQTFTNSFTEAVASEVRQTGFLTKNSDAYSVNFYVSRYLNFKTNAPGDTISIRQSPSVYVSGIDKQVGGSPFYVEFETSAAGVSRKEPGFATPRVTDRLDLYPRAELRSKPFWGFHLTPSVGLRATHYGTSLVSNNRDPLNRLLGDFSLDLRPPSLERVFSQTVWGHRFKHVVEPEVRYRLIRSLNDDRLRDVVRFDSVDIFAETHEVEYSLTNTLLARKDEPERSGEKPQASELISWRVSQKYYLDPTFGGALEPGKKFVFEPTISLSGFAFAQGRRLSPIVSVLKFSPLGNYNTELRADISPSGGGVRDVGLTSSAHRGRLGVGLTEFFINRTATVSTQGPLPPGPPQPADSSTLSFNLLQAVATYGDWNRKGLSAAFALAYNLNQGIAHNVVGQVSYNFGCFALDFEYRRLALGPIRRENQYRFALSLSNIGSFGNLKPGERLY